MKILGREPVLILAAVGAALNLAIGFGLNFSPEQVALANTFVAAVVSVIARQRVSPVNVDWDASLKRLVREPRG